MVYGRPKKKRKFYGKFYTLHAKRDTKAKATKYANNLRKQGWNAKVTKSVDCHYDKVGDYLCDEVYVIYLRRKKK